MTSKPLNLKASAPADTPTPKGGRPWSVLVVDDEEEVHAVTRLVLSRIVFKGRPVELVSAYSGKEALELLKARDDFALALLDVVMEKEDSGLNVAKAIREKIGNKAIRVVLRTGQPGQAPEEQVIVDYDINDYKAKSELTAQKLFTTVVASFRAYESIRTLERNREGLEKILDATDSLFETRSLQQFSSGVLTQLSGFLGCQPNGIMCATRRNEEEQNLADANTCTDLNILAASGEYADCLDCKIDGECRHIAMVELVKKALLEKKNQYDEEYAALYFDARGANASAALLHGVGPINDEDRFLLDVFASKISLALANAIHYAKMISAEEAATTDFLTGLPNRRELISLGTSILANARRNKQECAIAMIDIDHFKAINDTHGHDVGDVALKELAHILRERFREGDVVARFGGEEFTVVAPGVDREKAHTLFESVRREVEEHAFGAGDTTIRMTVSIGVTLQTGSLDEMIEKADGFLYAAKNGGRNRVVIDE